MNRRVVITGLGTISGAGDNADQLWYNIRHGITAITEYPLAVEKEVQFTKAAFIQDFNPTDRLNERQARLFDRSTQYALIAANEAIAHSGIIINNDTAHEMGVVTGTSIGGQDAQDRGFHNLYALNKKRIHPMTVPWIMPNAGACQINMEHGIKGPTFTTSTACSSSNHAIGQAFWLIKQGLIHTCVTGGHETPLSYGFMKAWEGLRVVSTDTCRPFSADRSGLILGEGAGMIVLEEMDRAINRGATIYAEIIG
ncbi:UNVERIFIED_CONTAM: hypothetical protein GTU68_047025, partial [Idotea baltica]|nr:hypothetical protein [Idotea baltica]